MYDEISRNVLETLTPSDPPKRTISLKEVETISSYEIVNDDVIVGKQRSLTFLVPSQGECTELDNVQVRIRSVCLHVLASLVSLAPLDGLASLATRRFALSSS